MIFQCILGFKDKFYHLLFRRLYIYIIILFILFAPIPAYICQSSDYFTSMEQDGSDIQPFNLVLPISLNINFPPIFNQFNASVKYGPDFYNKNICIERSRIVNTNSQSRISVSFELNYDTSKFMTGDFHTWIINDSNNAVWNRAWYEVKIQPNIGGTSVFTENRVGSPILIKPKNYTSQINITETKSLDNISYIDVPPLTDLISPITKLGLSLVELESPRNGSEIYTFKSIKFNYIPKFADNIDRCMLNIKGIYNGINISIIDESPTNDTINSINHIFNQSDKYICSVSCQNETSQTVFSNDICLTVKSPEIAFVRNCVPPEVEYTSISDAIRSLSPGGKVYVDQGNFTEHIHIDKPLHLIGLNKPTITGVSEYDEVIRISSSDVVIEGFTISGHVNGIKSRTSGNDYSNISIKNNIINCTGMYGICLEAVGNSMIDNIIIDSNEIDNCAEVGVYLIKCRSGNVFNNLLGFHSINRLNWGIYRTNCNSVKLENNSCRRVVECWN